jgi:hypothetical protein
MLKTTLLASAFAALVLVPTAVSAGDRGGQRAHFARAPKVVLVLPHRPFALGRHLRVQAQGLAQVRAASQTRLARRAAAPGAPARRSRRPPALGWR